MIEPIHDSDYKTYQVEYALDSDRFFRRSCASCGLHFKLSAELSELSTILAPIFAEMTEESMVSSMADPDSHTVEQLTCPYCGHTASQQEMHTDEFYAYMRQWILRHVIQPSMRSMFNGLAESFGGDQFIQITHQPSPISVQPIAGPELADMTRVRLLCCNSTIKILSCWQDLLYCPHCARHTVLH